ncbi:MAG: hypothetical protein CMF60_05715 [Magnetococcales bacterium]|nr:hypothetical protein [Magnetococcales bacterium]|tara:strand:- start:2437 stop:3885 length:1449 start_codon:yes stop_codon:yes gene_type:complete
MENNNQIPNPSNEDKLKELIEKFKELPKNAQLGIGAVLVLFVFMLLPGGDKPAPQQQPVATPVQEGNVQALQNGQNGGDAKFDAVAPSRESLQRGFYTQQRKELADLKSSLVDNVKTELQNVNSIKEAVTEQQQQMQQMIETFNEQIRSFERSNQQQRSEISRLVEQARVSEEQGRRQQALGGAPESVVRTQKKSRISQTTLRSGSGAGLSANPDQALLNFSNAPGAKQIQSATGASYIEKTPEPFVPPLGFVKGTLLNGFDALVGGAVPALVRLSGQYKTAMNSTVSLDGCIAFVEFEGQISTERAIGKPSRMTCVYPDAGAVTYSLSGYVVDANDGIVGVPGVFYEGDASRIAAALLADFAAGTAEIVRENQFTEETSEGGTATNLTGSAVQAEIAAGVSGMMGSLRDYLEERSSRVVPFVRVDPTRDIHMVLLSGFELRHEGSPWTLLVDGAKADQIKAENEMARKQAEEAAKQQNNRI